MRHRFKYLILLISITDTHAIHFIDESTTRILYDPCMTEITSQLIYEILRSIQTTLAEMKAGQADHTRQLLRIRDDINGLRGDDLRLESLQATMDARLERIERRLNLSDA
jgi:hypothetical protein